MKNLILYSFIIIIIITVSIGILSSSSVLDYSLYNINPEDIYISSSGFTWPIPNKYYISSYFGYRNINLYGASIYHSGIDIPANEGTYFLATIAGTITYTGFAGSGGFTINLENDNMKVTYCHTSPNFLVNVRRLC